MDNSVLNSIKSTSQGLLNQLLNPNLVLVLFMSSVLFSCSTTRVRSVKRQVSTALNSKFYNNQFTGVLVVDHLKKDTLICINSDKYFTPASNVKIFTLYSGLQLIPNKIPSLKYLVQNDTLYFEGTGDPSWLHPYFQDSTALEFLEGFKNLAFSVENYRDTKFGPGWAWEDYEFYFSPERGSIPTYGNVIKLFEKDSLVISPNFFKNSIHRKKRENLRDLAENKFFIPENLKDTLEIPFKTSKEFTKTILQNQLAKKLRYIANFPKGEKTVLYGIETDSIYKRMLYESDNFLAEQLMLVATSTLSDTLNFKTSRDYILQSTLSGLKQPPRWADGSGLSRYNLFTPESFVQVLTLLKEEINEQRLFHLFPSWNASGTITKSKNVNEIPFIYAKSGGMGNVYNLSGYLKTKSDRILIFSFMNNHFRSPSREVRQNMYTILKKIHDAY
ncbi:D-alanyl-D-alanine carboxypeptidase [Croceitalea rosinachiae]|uniref:D-alanyl-D-alanine carboxypeptidase n=1 Tax=Croceitalea rosinachiae TaxID=3075596 RepID=A0ABU3AA77_9FLAO|nr:D-alanyl-D-alanine carboxypeptidase [Croceitalea sp. F388]MDT0607084.1 D-alanyl-D-alanine carboxypeptidase [Croceitalea sp. F388]